MLAEVLHGPHNLVSMRVHIPHKRYCVAFIIHHLECDRVIMPRLPLYLVLSLVIAALPFD